MPKAINLTKEQILRAMRHTKSNMAAARYLGVSYIHYKKWAKFYEATEEGYANLHEQHLNPSGKGIPKFLKGKGKEAPLIDIIEGRIDASSFKPEKLKYRLLQEGHLKEECSQCGFSERRVLDYKMPLLLNFKDSNKKNWKLDNLEMLCYNHYFLTIGDIFTDKQTEGMETHKTIYGKAEPEWELDPYQKQRLKELGLIDDDEEDEYDIVSRI